MGMPSHALRELMVLQELKKLDQPNIVEYKGAHFLGHKIYFLFEYCKNDLYQVI